MRVSGRLFDDRTGVLIWTGAAEELADSRDDRQEQGGWLEGVLDSLVASAIDALACSVERAGAEVTERMLRWLPQARSEPKARTGE